MKEHELCCGTVANKAKLCAEIERRDRVIAAQQRRIEELLQERDGAVAQVERLRGEIAAIMGDSRGVAGYHLNGEVARWGEFSDLEEMLSETQPAALAALKAQWQADGALMFAGHAMVKYRYDFCDWAKLFANELQQRAQEAGDAPHP